MSLTLSDVWGKVQPPPNRLSMVWNTVAKDNRCNLLKTGYQFPELDNTKRLLIFEDVTRAQADTNYVLNMESFNLTLAGV